MGITNSVVATFEDHTAAETAIRRLTAEGFPMKTLSVVGKGYHSDDKVLGFYNTGDRMTFWGTRGAFWGGLWGLFFGGIVLAVPVVGDVVALGFIANALISTVEGAVVGGGLGLLGVGLYGIGIPRDSIVQYEKTVQANGFLVMAHGSAAVIGRARDILEKAAPTRLDVHRSEPLTATAIAAIA